MSVDLSNMMGLERGLPHHKSCGGAYVRAHGRGDRSREPLAQLKRSKTLPTNAPAWWSLRNTQTVGLFSASVAAAQHPAKCPIEEVATRPARMGV